MFQSFFLKLFALCCNLFCNKVDHLFPLSVCASVILFLTLSRLMLWNLKSTVKHLNVCELDCSYCICCYLVLFDVCVCVSPEICLTPGVFPRSRIKRGNCITEQIQTLDHRQFTVTQSKFTLRSWIIVCLQLHRVSLQLYEVSLHSDCESLWVYSHTE